MQINVTVEELNLLAELLRCEYQDLREEIYRTEDHHFKAELHAKENVIEALLMKVEPGKKVKTA